MGAPDPGHASPQGRHLSGPGGRSSDSSGPGGRSNDSSGPGCVRRIEASLAKGGLKVTRDSVAGRQAVIGRTARFRAGSRRHIFVLVALFKAGMAGREHLDRFLDEAGQYAATVKGGLASGATAVAVAVVEAAGEDGGWARTASERPRRGCEFAFPVLVDAVGGSVSCPEAPADLRRLVAEYVGASVRMV